MNRTPLFVLALGCLIAVAARAAEPQPLFDGKTLTGWQPVPADAGRREVKDGILCGTSPQTEKRHGILLSDKTYRDFKVRIVYRALAGNSGFYFRCEPVNTAVTVKGFQAEISAAGTSDGGLYETSGRAWVAKPAAELTKKSFRPKDWNEMIVTAQGGHLTVTLNGVTTAELKDDPGRAEGYFGMQLHGGQEMNVEFKTIEVLP